MQKRSIMLVLLTAMMVVLSGCTQVIDLSDEQTTLIAEYAADLLLQHDWNYNDKLEEGNIVAQEMQAESTEETVEITEESTEADSTEEVSDKETEEVSENTTEATVVGTESDIAKVINLEGAKISYKDYIITQQYPSEEELDSVYLDASEGYQLLVLRFTVSNTTKEDLKVSLIDEALDYRIVCNGGYGATPMLTMLMNDLGTLEITLEPEQTQEAVLLFQISDDMKDKLEEIEFYIQYNEAENMFKIS